MSVTGGRVFDGMSETYGLGALANPVVDSKEIEEVGKATVGSSGYDVFGTPMLHVGVVTKFKLSGSNTLKVHKFSSFKEATTAEFNSGDVLYLKVKKHSNEVEYLTDEAGNKWVVLGWGGGATAGVPQPAKAGGSADWNNLKTLRVGAIKYKDATRIRAVAVVNDCNDIGASPVDPSIVARAAAQRLVAPPTKWTNLSFSKSGKICVADSADYRAIVGSLTEADKASLSLESAAKNQGRGGDIFGAVSNLSLKESTDVLAKLKA